MNTFATELANLNAAVLTKTEQRRLHALKAKPMSHADCVYAWSRHNEIVDHTQRDGVDAGELSDLIQFLYATFPVVISEVKETLEGDKYTHLTGLALDASGQRYIWCGVCLFQFKPDGIFETCIADESSFTSLMSQIAA